MLWLQQAIPLVDLKHLKHSRLKALIDQHLVQTKKLDRSFLTAYDDLQELREYANYDFGSKNPKFEYQHITPTLRGKTELILSKTASLLITDLRMMGMMFAFQTTIGDDIGSDLVELHVTKRVGYKVWDYLVSSGLTT